MEIRYSSLGLKNNPFPRIPIPSEEPEVTFDKVGIVERIVREALYTSKTLKSNTLVLVGPYGSGKTHYMVTALLKLKNAVKNAMYLYISTPGSSIQNLLSALIEKLDPDDLLKLLSKNSSNLHRIMSILEKKSEYKYLFYAWLRGEPIEGKYRYKLGLTSRLTDERIPNIISTLISGMSQNGIVTYIFIDEFESILNLPTYKRQRYLSSLRRLIDLTPRGLFLTIAITPAGWDEILSSSYDLVRRISRNIIFIPPLTLEDAEKVIALYVLKSSPERINPFTKDAIKELFIASNGLIGDLIKLAGLAVDIAALKGKKIIDREIIIDALSEYGGPEGTQ